MMLISKQFLNKVKSSIVVGPPEFNFRVDKICQICKLQPNWILENA